MKKKQKEKGKESFFTFNSKGYLQILCVGLIKKELRNKPRQRGSPSQNFKKSVKAVFFF